MKWSIVGLLGLGLVAALCATLLVSSLLTSQQPRAASVRGNDLEVVVAKADLPAMTLITGQHVEIRLVPRSEVTKEMATSDIAVVGKLLTVPMIQGQPFNRSFFASEGSGAMLAAALAEGKRAMSISLKNSAGMAGLLYPGSVVDVIASISAPREDGGVGDVVSFSLLQGVQVLAVEQETILTNEEQGATRRAPATRDLMVTLMVDTKQAQALQLALQYGSVSLAMRNPLDPHADQAGYFALSDLAPAIAGPTRDEVGRMIQQSEVNILSSIDRLVTAAVEPAQATPLFNGDAQGANTARPDADLQRLWQTTVIRGSDVRTQSFDLTEPGQEQP